MRAGDYRHRITFQERGQNTDTFGAQTTTWTNFGTPVWAKITPLSGRELLAAQAINVEISHKVELRWQKQFSGPVAVAALRISYLDRIFNIHSAVDVEERHRDLEIHCSEGLNNG